MAGPTQRRNSQADKVRLARRRVGTENAAPQRQAPPKTANGMIRLCSSPTSKAGWTASAGLAVMGISASSRSTSSAITATAASSSGRQITGGTCERQIALDGTHLISGDRPLDRERVLEASDP